MDNADQQSAFELVLNPQMNSDLTDVAKKNRAAVIDAYQRMLKGEMEAWWNLFDPAVEFYEADSLPYGCTARGLPATQAAIGAMFAAWSHLRVEIENFIATGDLVINYCRMTGTSKKTGKVYDGLCAEVYRFRHGKIIEMRPVYWDTHKVREVCGLEAGPCP